MRGGSVALIISDGWDRGEPELLSKEMARLQRSCHRLIWLNPLLGSPDYQPLAQGIQAALPYIDDFLPAHNLNTLDSLAGYLSRLSQHRGLSVGRRRASGVGPSPPPDGGVSTSREINPALASTLRHSMLKSAAPQ
jgi:hypothetical protein